MPLEYTRGQPSSEDVQRLLLEILERAIRDLFILDKTNPDFETAFSLVFNDTYRIYYDELDQYGKQKEEGSTLSLEEMFQYFNDMDIDYIRYETKRELFSRKYHLAVELFGEPKEKEDAWGF